MKCSNHITYYSGKFISKHSAKELVIEQHYAQEAYSAYFYTTGQQKLAQ